MQVILLEQVRKLGNIGEVVNVKDGFARNFLLPNNKALRATKANIDFFETQKKDISQKNEELIKQAQATAKKIDSIIIDVISQAGEDGRLYGSVTVTDIAKSITEKSGITIERKQVALHDPIKYIDIHVVDIDLHAQVSVKVNVNVARTKDEAKTSASLFAKGGETKQTTAPANDEDTKTDEEEAA